MKGIFKKIFTLFLTIVTILTITSCGKKKKEIFSYNPNLSTIRRDDDLDLDMFDGYDLNTVEVENPDKYCCTYKDVEPNFGLNVYAKSSHLGADQLQQSISIVDSEQNEVKPIFNQVQFNDGETHPLTFTLTPSDPDGYKKGEVYTVSLENNENIFFADRDENIRRVMFSVKEDDKDNLKLVDTYPFYDSSNITYFDGYGDYDTYLIYHGKFNQNVGDVVGFKDPKKDVDDDTIYIKITKIEKLKNKVYKVHYSSPKADELFKELDCHVDDKKVDMEKYLNLNTQDEIIKQLKESTFVEECMAHAAYAYNFDKNLLEDGKSFWDKCFIDLAFNLQDGGFIFGITMSYTDTLKNGWRIMIVATAKFSYALNVSGDAEITTNFLGIPDGVNLKASAENDVKFGIEFRAVVANPKFNPDWMEATPQNYKWEDAQKAVKELKNKWLDKGGQDMNRDAVEGDTLLLNLGWISFRIAGWIAFDFDLYLCVKNQLNISIGLGYTYSYHSVLISYSSSSESSDSDCSPSKISEHAINGSLIGKYSAELYLKLRLSVYITGLKWLACFYIDVDAGFYFEISGMVELNYDILADDFDASGAFLLEFGLFFRVTVNFSIIGIVHPNFTLVDVRFPAIKFTVDNSLKERASDEHPKIELTNNTTNSNSTQMFTYRVFDANSLGEVVKNFTYDQSVTVLVLFGETMKSYTMFGDFEVNVKTLTTLGDATPSNDMLRFENGIFYVDSSVAELNATINYKYYDITGEKYNDYVDVHFLSDKAVWVSFDGQNRKAYLPGDKVQFPRPTNIPGKVFRGYNFDGKLYHSFDEFIMPDHDVDFEVIYIDDKEFTVEYYDGNNNLVYTEKVFNQDSAIGPSASVRDAKMTDEFEFICYDQPLDCITSDMKVHAIYTRKGDR